MERGELLNKVQKLPIDLVRSVREALKRREAKKYGTEAERKAAYATLNTTFEGLFERFKDKVGIIGDDNQRRLVFELTDKGELYDRGLAFLDEPAEADGNYRLLILGKETPIRYKRLTEYRKPRVEIITNGKEATMRLGHQSEFMSQNWSPIHGGGYWDTTDKLGKSQPLDAISAMALAIKFSQLPAESIITGLFAHYPDTKQ
jgi:hypothetical protein